MEVQDTSNKFKKDSERVPTVKLVVVGPGEAGKTSLLKIYSLLMRITKPENVLSKTTKIANPFEETAMFDQTVFGLGTKVRDEREIPVIKYALYTVAGQRRYRDARKIVLNGADGLILLLDPTNPSGNVESLRELQQFLGDVNNLPFAIAINKCDLSDLPSQNETLQALVKAGITDSLADLKVHNISTLNARNALLGLLNIDPSDLFTEDGLLKTEHFPEVVSDIISMVNGLTKEVIESKLR